MTAKNDLFLATFRQIANASPSIIMLTDREGKIVFVNRTFTTVTGYSEDEVLGENPRLLQSGQTKPEVYNALWTTIEAGEHWEGEFLNRKKSGDLYWEKASITPIADEMGRMRFFMAIKNDITEQKETLSRLEQANALLKRTLMMAQHAAEILQIGFTEYDLQTGELTYWDGMNRLLGFDPEETIDRERILSRFVKTDREAFLQRCQQARKKDEEGFSSVLRAELPDGSHKPLQVKVLHTRDEEGRIRKRQSFFVDISELHDLKREKSRSESLMEVMFENATEGMFFMMLDEPIQWDETVDKEAALDTIFAHQRITMANQAMLDQYGFEKQAYVGLTPNDFFAHDLAQGRSTWKEMLDAGRLSVETTERKGDGSELYVKGSYICLYDEKGRVTGHFGIQIDVTDQVRIKQQLQREVHHALMLKRRADEANAIKDRFLAKVSHEIRTPINAILGFAQLAERCEQPDDRDHYNDQILRAGRRLLRLVEDILDFSKINEEKITLQNSPFSVAELVEEVLGQARLLLPEGQAIHLESSIAKKIPSQLIGDAERLGQVLSNLLNNAIKFTEVGRVRLVVEPTACNVNRCLIAFRIVDSGIGMDEKRLGQLFKPFEQMVGIDEQNRPGTGLGLVISKGLVELMGGTMTVTSEPGMGSTFSVEIPFTQLEEPATAPSKKSGGEKTLDGRRILVVEDHEINQVLTRRMLERAGAEVVVASDGAQGERLALAEDFDLVLMDLLMPVMDGHEATIRILLEKPDLPIVALTANAQAGERERCLGIGMCDYLTKPFEMQALYRIIEKHLGIDQTAPVGQVMPAVAGPRLEGIDVDEALKKIGGDRVLFDDLLETFLRQFETEIPRIQSALREGDRDAVRRKAHSLRGGASSVGAMRIYQIAGELEMAAEKEPVGALEGLLEKLEAQMVLTISSVISYLDDRNADQQKGIQTLGEEAFFDLLQDLLKAVRNYDYEAVSLFKHLTHHQVPKAYRQWLDTLEPAILSYDFEAATPLLEKWVDDDRR